MGKKLYVGNIPFGVKEDFLRDLFGQAGRVESVNIITDRDTGRSKGFGFVEMSSDDEAQKAIEQLNGAACEGRNLTVNEARPKADNGGGGRSGGPRGGNGGGGGGGGFRPRRPRQGGGY